MKKHKKIYLVWKNGDQEQYWGVYDTLKEAVHQNFDETEKVEVFEADLKSLGKHSLQVNRIISKSK